MKKKQPAVRFKFTVKEKSKKPKKNTKGVEATDNNNHCHQAGKF